MFREKIRLNGDEFIIDESDLTSAGRVALRLPSLPTDYSELGNQFADLQTELRKLKSAGFASGYRVKGNKFFMTRGELKRDIEERTERAVERIDISELLKRKVAEAIKIAIGKLQGKVF